MVRLEGILSADVELVWDGVKDFIQDACDRMNGRHSPDTIKQLIKQQNAQLWLIHSNKIEATIVTEIIIYPLKKYCRIILIGGREVQDWAHLVVFLERWAKSKGCDGIEAIARKGWLKIDENYKQSHIFIERGF